MNTTTAPTAIETLRAMYRTVRAGGELDAQAYTDALLEVIADGDDALAITRAFQAFGYMTCLAALGLSEGAGSRVLRAKEARGWRGAIRVASALGLSDAWAAALTAHYGPTGTHESRRGADGLPTLETMEEFPEIAARMTEAADLFAACAAHHDRCNAKRPVRWGDVMPRSEFFAAIERSRAAATAAA